MKVLHISDLHYSPKHLSWVDKAVSHAIETAIRENCALAVISGDSFDHALEAHEAAFSAYVRQVVALADFMPTIDLQGTRSHDRPGCLDVLKAIPTRHPIIVADTPAHYDVGGCAVSCLPSVNKADTNFDMRETLECFAAAHAQARAAGMPTILVTHGTVTGSVTESHFAMVSTDHEFDLETLALADADAVMLGHIHKHQAWPDVLTPAGNRSTIAYAGSIARLTHGHKDPVGFLIWELGNGPARFTFHPSPSRNLLHIEFDGPPNMTELRQIAKDARPDDAVRIRWSVDEEHAHAIDKAAIRALFAGAEDVKLEGRVIPIHQVRAAGITRMVSLNEKLARYFMGQDTTCDIVRLQEKLDLLKSRSIDEIALG